MNPFFADQEGALPELPRRVYARVSLDDETTDGVRILSVEGMESDSFDEAVGRLSEQAMSDAPLSRALYDDGFDPRIICLEAEILDENVIRVIDPSWDWVALDVSMEKESADDIAAYAFLSLFGQPVRVYMQRVQPVPRRKQRTLQKFIAPIRPSLGAAAVKQRLATRLSYAFFETWHVIDVGQGSANAFGSNGRAHLFHDIGCGVKANAKTRPNRKAALGYEGAPIILSHWDEDHWAGALHFAPKGDPKYFLKKEWFALNDPTRGPLHWSFERSILAAGGTVITLPIPRGRMWGFRSGCGKSVTLIRGTGTKRNDSCIALEIEDGKGWCKPKARRWLSTADLDYAFHPALQRTYTGLTAPHHGSAAKKQRPTPPIPSGHYARLAFSFGHGNQYRHPSAASRAAHAHAHWGTRAGSNVLDTAAPQGRADIAIGWNAPPSAAAAFLRCFPCLNTVQT